MKTLKCLFALVLGSILGLLPSCSTTAPENKPPAPPGKSPGTQTNTVPSKQEDLPVRRPLYE